jgi:hypothetical protein
MDDEEEYLPSVPQIRRSATAQPYLMICGLGV